MAGENIKTVMIVDDEDETRRLLEFALKNAGYHVREANSGQKALEALGEFMPDAIVLDIVMPDMDGYTLVKKIKKIPDLATIPIVISSGKGGMKDFFELEDEIYRPDAFLVKPYKMKDLIDTVNRILK
ncbi:MAG: response regulator [Elusimicrobiota bacterium]